ncbi:hypothetical protein F4803DRAFT_548492 [Xylaria telfairii]|nr:hypothetical protein F4803DRAFT_548492 [Xylaria telfairii]
MAFEKAFKTNAFDLTEEEKHVTLGKVKSLLLRTGLGIQRANTFGASPAAWHELLDLVDKAILIAQDEDACDPALAPLVSCYLYKGHILLALGEEKRAYAAYEKAATGEAHALTDFPAVQQAASALLELRNKPKRETPPPQNPPSSNPRASEGQRPDSLFLPSGIDEIPLLVTVRPGPARKCPNATSSPNRAHEGEVSREPHSS